MSKAEATAMRKKVWGMVVLSIICMAVMLSQFRSVVTWYEGDVTAEGHARDGEPARAGQSCKRPEGILAFKEDVAAYGVKEAAFKTNAASLPGSTSAGSTERGPMTYSLAVDTDARYEKTENQYFDLYSGQTLREEEVSRIVDVSAIQAEGGLVGSWIAFEGFSGKLPNRYCLVENEGAMELDGIDLENQMYRGRYMVAVGPAVIMGAEYKGQYVDAHSMKYGTCLDIVLEGQDGRRHYIPCVVADCKASTYPQGYYQTGTHVAKDGAIVADKSARDWSFVEFTAAGVNADGTPRSEGMCANYKLVEIIVYKLGESVRWCDGENQGLDGSGGDRGVRSGTHCGI